MRILTVAALLIALTTAPKAANDSPWCYRDFGGPQYTNCFYYSVRECLIAAGIRGGVCERIIVPPPRHRKRTDVRDNRARPASAHQA